MARLGNVVSSSPFSQVLHFLLTTVMPVQYAIKNRVSNFLSFHPQIRIILECQNRTIARGPNSIFARLRKEGIDVSSDCLLSTRNLLF